MLTFTNLNWTFSVGAGRLVGMMLTGLYVPMITPYDERGGIAVDALATLTGEVLDAGAAGVVALGTTGEPSALSEAERRTAVAVIGRACRERSASLLVGANTADELARLRDLSDSVEVCAALTLVPPFLRPGEAGVLAHFQTLSAASPVPLAIYHVPYRTGQQLTAAALRRLAALPGVVGAKYATGGVDVDAVELLADPPPGFAILAGDDAFVSPMLALGAHGAVLASAHLATTDFVRLIEAWHDGDVTMARAAGHRLSGLSAALFAEPNPAVVKAVLHAQGRIPNAAVRLPLLPATAAATEAALAALAAIDDSAAPLL